MATWSRSQSQEAGQCKGASSGIKTTSSHHLARDAKVLSANKRENARIVRWAEEAPDYKKVRKYSDTIEIKLSRKARRALGGRVMSHANRIALLAKATAERKRVVLRNEMFGIAG